MPYLLRVHRIYREPTPGFSIPHSASHYSYLDPDCYQAHGGLLLILLMQLLQRQKAKSF